MSCDCNKKKPIKEAWVITRDNLKKWAEDAIYHPTRSQTGPRRVDNEIRWLDSTKPFAKNKKYVPPTELKGSFGKERDAMVKELIPFLAYLYKKHLKNVIVQEGKTPTFVGFIRENIRLENGKLLLKKKG